MAEPTKGPYYVGCQNDLLFITDKPPRPAPVDYVNPKAGHDTKIIASVAWRDMAPGEESANANMLAASWDMREALSALVAAKDRKEQVGADAQYGEMRGRAWAMARAALAKVEGSEVARG